MNIIDKRWYKALRYLSRYTPEEIKKERKNLQKYRKKVPKHVEDFFHAVGYIQFENKYPQVVTQGGLQQLRDLEDIRRKGLTLVASTVAVVLSLIAVVISLVALSKQLGLV
ncbi:hypothetical protein GOV13_04790 [Candidatus Pacearchaeota archaeon]|nr:hypothetical protein [Candidatus Pacearchaeota archaeon]